MLLVVPKIRIKKSVNVRSKRKERKSEREKNKTRANGVFKIPNGHGFQKMN